MRQEETGSSPSKIGDDDSRGGRGRHAGEKSDDLRGFKVVEKETADGHVVLRKWICRDVESMGLEFQARGVGTLGGGLQRMLADITGRPLNRDIRKSMSGPL